MRSTTVRIGFLAGLFAALFVASGTNARPSATANSLATQPQEIYSRADLQRLSKEQLVNIAYHLQQRALLAEASMRTQDLQASESSVVNRLDQQRIEPTNRSPILAIISSLAGYSLYSFLNSRTQESNNYIVGQHGAVQSTAFRRPIIPSIARSNGIPREHFAQTPNTGASEPMPTATTLPNTNVFPCGLSGGLSGVLAAFSPKIWPDATTDASEKSSEDLFAELPQMSQALFNCGVPSATQITAPTGQNTASVHGSRVFSATGSPNIVTFTASHSGQTTICNAGASFANYWNTTSANWAVNNELTVKPDSTNGLPAAQGATGEDLYVSLTYTVSSPANGETTPGFTWHIWVPSGDIAIVKAPPYNAQASGYNVYVGTNERNQTKQNSSEVRQSIPYPVDFPLATTINPPPTNNTAKLGPPSGRAPLVDSTALGVTGGVFQEVQTLGCTPVKPSVASQ